MKTSVRGLVPVVYWLFAALCSVPALALTRQAVPARVGSAEVRPVQVLLWSNTPALGLAQSDTTECAQTCRVISDRTRLSTSDVVVFDLDNDDSLVLPERSRRSQRFVAAFTQPAPRISQLQDDSFLGDFDGEVSYRLSADIFLSPIPQHPVNMLGFTPARKQSAGSAYIAYDESECTTTSHRDSFVKQLMKYVAVDSVGTCLNNKDRESNDTTALLAQYEFTLVLETDLTTDFVSSRLFDVLRAGSVPVYAGAANVDEFLPVSAKKCVIKVSDFNSTQQLAAHLQRLHNDPMSLQALLDWKTHGFEGRFLRRAQPTTTAACRLCEWARTQPSRHPQPVPAEDVVPRTVLSLSSDLLQTAQLLQGNVLLGQNGVVSRDCVNNCSSHGQCIERACVCSKGWQGLDCSVRQGECPNNCSRHGICIEEVCLCDDGWIGAGCERIDPRLQWQCEIYCGQRGVCVDGKCRCAEGYCGDDCSLLLGKCENDCSGHGSCCDSRCVCQGGWWGDKSCSTEGPSCPFDFDCNNHGACIDGKCICDKGYTDFDCSESVVVFEPLRRPGPANNSRADPCPFNCSGHGICIPATGCECNLGWDGKACDISLLTSCPVDYDCANGGECVKGKCINCKAGYTGFDCRTEPHPVDAKPPEQSMGERGNMILFAPRPTNKIPPELQGRAMLSTRFKAPPVVFVQANDAFPQSVAVASVAVTRKPHKFLADGRLDATNTQFAVENEPRAVLAVTQTLPRVVFDSMMEETPAPGSNASLPLPLQRYQDKLLVRPFSFVAIEQGIWRLGDGGLLIAGSAPICEILPDGKLHEWHTNHKLNVVFPRRYQNKRPNVVVGLMAPMLSAPLPGIVGVLRVEQVTLTDFTVTLPRGLCEAIRTSRSLSAESAAQMMMQLEERAFPGDKEWGDDVQEYVTGKCVRMPTPAGPPANPYAFEFRDYAGVPASQRPCSDSSIDPDVLDTTANITTDAGYGPKIDTIEVENAYPSTAGMKAANPPPRNFKPRPPGLGKLVLSYFAVPHGADHFEGGVRIHSVMADLPVSPELVPMDIDLGYGSSGDATSDGFKRPTLPHAEAMMKNLTTLTKSKQVLHQNPETGAWEYEYLPLTEGDYPSTCVLSTVYDPTNTQALSLAFRPGRELELSVTDTVTDEIEIKHGQARNLLNSLMLLQAEAELDTANVTSRANSTAPTNATLATVATPIAMGESLRVVLTVPPSQRSNRVRVMLSRAYERGVAIAEPLTKSPLLNEPMVSLVHGVSGSEMSISLVKPSAYANDAGAATNTTEVTEKVNIIVMDSGVYETVNSKIVVGTINTDSVNPHSGWIQVNFSMPFARPPVVLSQVQSYNVPNATAHLPYLKTRHAKVTTTGFLLAIEGESEAFIESLGNAEQLGQTIGIIAVDVGPESVDTWGTIKVHGDSTGSALFDNWFSINFAQTMVASVTNDRPVTSGQLVGGFAPRDTSTAPVFVAHTKTYNSDSPCHARIRNLVGDGVDVKIESDDLASPRTADDKEALSFFVVSAAAVLKTSRHKLFSPDTDTAFIATPAVSGVSGGALFKAFRRVPPPEVERLCPGAPACNEHGVCNKTTGLCQCEAFWTGPACSLPTRQYIGENGRLEISLQFKRQLHTIAFRHEYTNPVVFLSPTTNAAGDIPIVARVASVTSTFCTVFLEQPHHWLGGPTNVHGPETLMYMVLEKGVWEIDEQGNSIEVSTITTSAAAGLESVSVAFKRSRGPKAAEGRKTKPVVLSQLQSANNPLMVHSVLTKVQATHASVALEAERVVHPQNTSSPELRITPDPTWAVRSLRLTTSGATEGRLSGVLNFDSPLAVANLTMMEFVFATSRNASSVVGVPLGKISPVPNNTFSFTFSNVSMPSSAEYILVVTYPRHGNPAFVPIIPNDENPYFPQPVPFDVDPRNLPLLAESVGLLVMSAGVGKWDNKSYIANSKAPLNQANLLQWVDFLDPQLNKPYPLVTFESAPSTYLAGLDPETTQLGTIPAHLSLGSTFSQSVDKSSAKIKLDVEIKRDRAKDLPNNLTASYFAIVQEGLLSAQEAGCPNSCSNNGVCVANICICDSNHGDEDCSQLIVPAECVPACTGEHTQCIGGKCVCANGFTGAACTIAVADINPAPVVETLCPRNCSNHGRCNRNTTQCVCEEGWAGEDCATAVCIGGCNEPMGGACVSGKCVCARTYGGNRCTERVCYPDPTCHSNGACVDGACVCNQGWRGDDCTQEIPAPTCPNFCSGHGECVKGTCHCQTGYIGEDCGQIKPCPKGEFMGQREECTGHGWCNKGECVCSTGWLGAACDQIDPTWDADCPFDCSGRGKCTPSGCICDEPYGGRGCRQMKDGEMDMGEVLSVVVRLSHKTPVQTVAFSRRYRSPVVIANPPSRSHPAPFSVQILAVGTDHFNLTSVQAQLALMRQKYNSPTLQMQTQSMVLAGARQGSTGPGVPVPGGSNTTATATPQWSVEEMLTVVVVEEGSWDLRNGLLLHAGKVPVSRVRDAHGAFSQGFSRFFTTQPSVFAQTQSVHNHILARARVRSSKPKAFVLGLDMVNATNLAADALWGAGEQDDDDNGNNDDHHAKPQLSMHDEAVSGVAVGWLAIGESSSSTITSPDPKRQFKFGAHPFFHGVRNVQLNTEWHRFPFAADANLANPRFIADTAFAASFSLRFHALAASGVSLALENLNGTLHTEPSHSCMLSVMAFGSEGVLRAHALQCPDKCGYDGERGKCEKSKCICESEWAGLTCKVPATKCPNNCTTNGACTSSGCRCKVGWVGADCSTPVPHVRVELVSFSGVGDLMGAKVADCEDDCSGHGTCLAGICNCTDPEWLGYKCHEPNPCVRRCSGHGQCVVGEGCLCDGGWGGAACDEPSLMCPYDYDCGAGVCVEGRCQCDEHHFGFNCQRLIPDAAAFKESDGNEPEIHPWQKAS